MSDTTFGVKVPEELKTQLDGLMKDSGLRTGKDFMQHLANIYTLEKTKEQIPEVAQDLKELQTLTQRINNIYLNLGYRIENITKGQQQEAQDQLQSKNSIITDLQAKIENFKIENDTLNNSYSELVNQNNDYLQRVNELTESNINIKELNEEYKNKNDDLLSIVSEYKQYKIEVEEYKKLLAEEQSRSIAKENIIKDNDFAIKELNKTIDDNKNEWVIISDRLKADHEKELQTVKDKLIFDRDNIIKDKDYTINHLDESIEKLNKTIEKLTQEHEKSIEELNQDNQKELEILKKENQLNIKLAVAEVKDELNNKLNQEQLKHNNEIEEYQNKYKQLLQEQEQERKATPKAKVKESKTKETDNK